MPNHPAKDGSEQAALDVMLADAGWQVVRKRLERQIDLRKTHLARSVYDSPEKVYELAREQGIIATLENLLERPKETFYDPAEVKPPKPSNVRSSLPPAAQRGVRSRPVGMG